METGIIPKLVELLSSDEVAILTPALRTVGNIVTGSDVQTDAVLSAGGLPRLCVLLQHNRHNIVKEAAWAVSNITAGNTDQIQRVIDAGLLSPLIDVLKYVSTRVYMLYICFFFILRNKNREFNKCYLRMPTVVYII